MRGNGKTKAGTQRFRCINPECGASGSRAKTRQDVARRHELGWFINWVLKGEYPEQISKRTFHRRTQWCWNIDPAPPTPTGVIDRYLMMDGTYFNDYCVLVAYNGTHVVNWLFCDQERKNTWHILLQHLAPPDIAVVDGNKPLETVISELWPQTQVQRCYFHIRKNIHTHLTRKPRLQAGQELLALAKTLKKIQDLDEAAKFVAEFISWTSRWDALLKQRTYRKDYHGKPPSYVTASQQWWYTHLRLRRAYLLINRLISQNQLFTWLQHRNHEDELLPKTTNPLEGGINAGIKELLRRHRGLAPDHAMKVIGWYLNERTENPVDPWNLARPEHWQKPTKTRSNTRQQQSLGPALYDNQFSWEDGNGIQQGWAGNH